MSCRKFIKEQIEKDAIAKVINNATSYKVKRTNGISIIIPTGPNIKTPASAWATAKKRAAAVNKIYSSPVASVLEFENSATVKINVSERLINEFELKHELEKYTLEKEYREEEAAKQDILDKQRAGYLPKNLNDVSVNYKLKAVKILSSDKSKQVFAKGKKNGWDLKRILNELEKTVNDTSNLNQEVRQKLNKVQKELQIEFKSKNKDTFKVDTLKEELKFLKQELKNNETKVEEKTEGIPKEQKKIILDGKYDTYISELSLRESIIISLLAENSFAVEINTTTRLGTTVENPFTHDTPENTQHYSNLTVPGGTNYIENEIVTPGITPNIEGHAKFSTANGIGWFRSDEQGNTYAKNDPAYLDDIQEDFEDGKITEEEYEVLKNKEDVFTKTRRILEVQSDLFQKGRDKKDLITPEGRGIIPHNQLQDFEEGNIPSSFNIYSDFDGLLDRRISVMQINNKVVIWKNEEYDNKIQPFVSGETKNQHDVEFWVLDEITSDKFLKEYKESLKKEVLDQKILEQKTKENQFLQLLNKKGNWVNFFIQSIVQDSIKKGYEKVLFPTGETAAKVEGHDTLADSINNDLISIEELEKENKDLHEEYDSHIIAKNNIKIGQLKEGIQATKEQGLEKLKPVEAFYTNRVTNILNKLYDVKEITDEYGNTWNEIDITKFQNKEGGYELPEILLDINVETNTIEPDLTKMIRFYEQTLSDAYRSMASIDEARSRNQQNKEEYKRLTQKYDEVKGLIYGNDDKGLDGLVHIIEDLKSKPPQEKFLMYIENDLDRIDTLLGTDSVEDKNEAKNIISFYDNMFKEGESVFFTPEELASKGINTIKELMTPLRNRVEGYRAQVNAALVDAATKSANTIINAEELFGKGLTSEELFNTEGGLKDIDKLSAYIMSPEFQLTGNNGYNPQIQAMILKDAWHRENSYLSSFLDRLGRVEPVLVKEMKRLGDRYSIFRATDKYGNLKDRIVTRITQEFMDSEKAVRDTWKEKRKNIRKQTQEDQAISYEKLKDQIFDHYNKNYTFFRPEQISEVIAEFPEMFGTEKVDGSHEKQLKDLLGEQGYQEEVYKQIQKIKEYQTRKQIKIEELQALEESTAIDHSEALAIYEAFEYNNNPLRSSSRLAKGERLNTLNYDNEISIHKIPNRETGAYDANFSKIEANPIYKEAHTILLEYTENLKSSLNKDERSKINPFSLAATRKTLIEILTSPDNNLLSNLSEIFWRLLHDFKDLFRTNLQDQLTTVPIDPATGKIRQYVRAEGLHFNKSKVNREFNIALGKFKVLAGVGQNYKFPDIVNFASSNPKIISEFAELLGVENSLEAIKRRLPNIDLNKMNFEEALLSVIENNVVADNSIDIFKAVRVSSKAVTLYKARTKALPLLMVMREKYKDVKAIKSDALGRSVMAADGSGEDVVAEGSRENAVAQYESWFKRNVLADYSTPGADTTYKDSESFKKLSKIKAWNTDSDNTVQDLTKLITNIEQDISNTSDGGVLKELQREKSKFESYRNSVTKTPNAMAFLNNALLPLLRFKSLAYNLNSASTNLLEGQLSNIRIGTSGKYFEPDNFWRANSIMRAQWMRPLAAFGIDSKSTSIGKARLSDYELAYTLMHRFDLMQDVYSSELQKADKKSALNKFKLLAPKELTNRVEYRNQAPIMIATLMETMITDKDGNEMSVWDAMSENALVDEIGKLPERFRTPSNILNYELTSTDEKSALLGQGAIVDKRAISRVGDTITKFHGDYSQFGGMLAGDTPVGTILMMFKRWIGMQLYSYYGSEQMNLYTGQKEKGAFRSLTESSGSLLGGTVGLLAAGPAGALIGAGVGAAVSRINAINTDVHLEHNLNYLDELAVSSMLILKRMVGIPANFLLGNKVDVNKLTGMGKLEAKRQELVTKKLNKVDTENLYTNLTTVSNLLTLMATYLVMKAALAPGDDDNIKRRKWRNLMANKILGLQEQNTMYMNIFGTYNAMFDGNSIAAFRFVKDISNFSKASINLLKGEDEIQEGIYIGQSETKRQLKKIFLPSLLRSGDLGFDGLMQRQFSHSWADDWFKPAGYHEKKELKAYRNKLKAQWKEAGKTDKEIKKDIKVTYKKAKEEGYTKALERTKKLVQN